MSESLDTANKHQTYVSDFASGFTWVLNPGKEALQASNFNW